MTMRTARMVLEGILDDHSDIPKRPRIAELIGEVTLNRDLGEASARELIKEYEYRIAQAHP